MAPRAPWASDAARPRRETNDMLPRFGRPRTLRCLWHGPLPVHDHAPLWDGGRAGGGVHRPRCRRGVRRSGKHGRAPRKAHGTVARGALDRQRAGGQRLGIAREVGHRRRRVPGGRELHLPLALVLLLEHLPEHPVAHPDVLLTQRHVDAPQLLDLVQELLSGGHRAQAPRIVQAARRSHPLRGARGVAESAVVRRPRPRRGHGRCECGGGAGAWVFALARQRRREGLGGLAHRCRLQRRCR
mmetsp:Transcript_129437/g.362354  ORF Transcript_129437/g.362354 Transcript_129437/m.362354 type:complete len:242 (+) Transcript_129437:126-851(+)